MPLIKHERHEIAGCDVYVFREEYLPLTEDEVKEWLDWLQRNFPATKVIN